MTICWLNGFQLFSDFFRHTTAIAKIFWHCTVLFKNTGLSFFRQIERRRKVNKHIFRKQFRTVRFVAKNICNAIWDKRGRYRCETRNHKFANKKFSALQKTANIAAMFFCENRSLSKRWFTVRRFLQRGCEGGSLLPGRQVSFFDALKEIGLTFFTRQPIGQGERCLVTETCGFLPAQCDPIKSFFEHNQFTCFGLSVAKSGAYFFVLSKMGRVFKWCVRSNSGRAGRLSVWLLWNISALRGGWRPAKTRAQMCPIQRALHA